MSVYWLAHVEDELGAGDRLPEECDVVVIGGGIVGVAATYWLARAGVSPLLLERRELGHGASGRNGGFVLSGSSSIEDPSLLRCVLRDEAIDADYTEPGHLALAGSEEIFAVFEREAQSRPASAPPIHTIDHDSCEDVAGVRLSRTDFYGGRWFPGAATIHPARLVYGLAKAAVRRGATIATKTPVTRLTATANGVVVTTPRGRVGACRALVACGGATRTVVPATRSLLAPSRGQMLATQPMKPHFRVGLAVDFGSVYWRQAPDGVIVLGGCRAADPTREATSRQALNPRIQAALTAFLPRACPALPYVTVDTRWAGIMDDTPDGRPLVGAVGGTELWVAAGFGGHGLPPALGVGRALADGLTSGRAPDSLAAFTPARFEREAA